MSYCRSANSTNVIDPCWPTCHKGNVGWPAIREAERDHLAHQTASPSPLSGILVYLSGQTRQLHPLHYLVSLFWYLLSGLFFWCLLPSIIWSYQTLLASPSFPHHYLVFWYLYLVSLFWYQLPSIIWSYHDHIIWYPQLPSPLSRLLSGLSIIWSYQILLASPSFPLLYLSSGLCYPLLSGLVSYLVVPDSSGVPQLVPHLLPDWYLLI